ncbi:MAG: hypothetical protein ACJ704_01990 [Nitrososphaeraceae archaeon]
MQSLFALLLVVNLLVTELLNYIRNKQQQQKGLALDSATTNKDNR